MKKVASVFLALLLCFGIQLGAFADSATLKTVVPDTHEITVAYNDGAMSSVTVLWCKTAPRFRWRALTAFVWTSLRKWTVT